MMVPIAYAYDWLAGILGISAIPVSSIPSTLNFYPSYNIQYVPDWLFNSIVKLPFLISDILVALLLYKIINKLTNKKGLGEKAALLWFLNPFVIWISAGWGMWDTMPVLFTLLAFYFLIDKRLSLSAIALSLAVASKLYPVLIIFPIIVYLHRSSPEDLRKKNVLKYSGILLISLIILFLPYLNQVLSYFSSHLIQVDSATSQVTGPFAFGLSYWSLYSLNRLFNLPVSASLTTAVSYLSVGLVTIGLLVCYWLISKFRFGKSANDLAYIFLLPLIVFFLTFRFICEQWFIWIIPFLIILCINGRIKVNVLWALTAIALIYVFMNLPFPFFFLPLSPWLSNSLVAMVQMSWMFEPFRFVSMSLLGVLFSILLFIILKQQHSIAKT